MPEHPSPRQVLEVHARLLERWRKAMNLVGPGPVEPHMEDARQAALLLRCEGTWADLGSGAGFPGVALAAFHPEADFILVESRQKRAAFLRIVLQKAGLRNARVLEGRVEDMPPGGLDGVTARAFAPPLRVLEEARRLLRPGGTAVLFLTEAAPPHIPGMALASREGYRVGDRRRSLALYTRTTEEAPRGLDETPRDPEEAP